MTVFYAVTDRFIIQRLLQLLLIYLSRAPNEILAPLMKESTIYRFSPASDSAPLSVLLLGETQRRCHLFEFHFVNYSVATISNRPNVGTATSVICFLGNNFQIKSNGFGSAEIVMAVASHVTGMFFCVENEKNSLILLCERN